MRDVTILDDDPCNCGRKAFPRYKWIIGRLDDVIHYRGAKIWPRVIQETIMKFPEVLEYQVEVDRFGPSGFTIKVEMDNKKDNSEIKKEILAEMRKN
jgi:phenylacetate-CoA ligase